MAEANAFEQDIFISYAHDDDLPLMEGDKGWVSEFHQTLEALVRQISGDDIHIWRDPKLQGNDFFADTLEDSLPRTAVLVSIVSPRYLKSEWCLRELTCFYKGAESSGGLRVADKSRIFKVVKTQIPREHQPTPLSELLGYEFYRIDPASGKPVEFRKELGPEAQQSYIAKLYDTAYEITDILGKLRDAGAMQEKNTPLSTVYLAETTSDLRDERDRIKTELRQQGYTVLPDEPLPLNGEGFSKAVADYLERSALSIHLIGAKPGMVPEDERRSAVRLQNDVAARFSAERGLRRIIWIKPDAAASGEGRGKLIEVLEVNADAQQGADLLKSGVEELKNVISDRLHQLQREHDQKQSDSAKDNANPDTCAEERALTAYLICDQCDFDATQPLADYLYDQGFDLLYPVFEGDESELREDHMDKLASCDVSVFYCGQATDLWLSSKLRDLRKLAGYREGKSQMLNAVCLAAPQAPWKQRFRNRDTMVINTEDSFAPEQAAALIAAVKASRGETNT